MWIAQVYMCLERSVLLGKKQNKNKNQKPKKQNKTKNVFGLTGPVVLNA
jgi:hypothetical protein